MISVKTSALIAAIAVLGTVAPAAFVPAAFAQEEDESFNFAILDDIRQSIDQDFNIDQSQSATATATTGDYSTGDATAAISQDQGFCLQVNNNQQVSGRDSDNENDNEISADADATAEVGSIADADASVDCS